MLLARRSVPLAALWCDKCKISSPNAIGMKGRPLTMRSSARRGSRCEKWSNRSKSFNSRTVWPGHVNALEECPRFLTRRIKVHSRLYPWVLPARLSVPVVLVVETTLGEKVMMAV